MQLILRSLKHLVRFDQHMGPLGFLRQVLTPEWSYIHFGEKKKKKFTIS